MAGCIPKHVACEWHIPNFIAGPTGCTLPVGNENRARREAGGTLFRSIAAGDVTNDIEIKIDYVPEIVPAVGTVTLEIYINGLGLQESHSVAQGGSPFQSGIPLLRTKLNTDSSLIIMPTIDVQTTGTGTFDTYTNIWDSSLDDDTQLSDAALVALKDGEGPRSDTGTLDGIRTGPAYTMAHIEASEMSSAEGVLSTLGGGTRYWNGACWKSFDPVVPDCAGSPLICGAGPETDCP